MRFMRLLQREHKEEISLYALFCSQIRDLLIYSQIWDLLTTIKLSICIIYHVHLLIWSKIPYYLLLDDWKLFVLLLVFVNHESWSIATFTPLKTRVEIRRIDPHLETATGSWEHHLLGGGFKYFLLFNPSYGEDSHFDWYFSNGLKPPTSLPNPLFLQVKVPEVASTSPFCRSVVWSIDFCPTKNVALVALVFGKLYLQRMPS